MTCKAADLAGQVPPEDADLYRRLLAGHGDGRGRMVSADHLALALSRRGVSVGSTTVKDHRAGRCACARAGKADA